MTRLILFFDPTRRKPLSNLQLKELARYFFTLSSLGFGSILVKLFEAEKLTLDSNALFGVISLSLIASGLAYLAVKLLGAVRQE